MKYTGVWWYQYMHRKGYAKLCQHTDTWVCITKDIPIYTTTLIHEYASQRICQAMPATLIHEYASQRICQAMQAHWYMSMHRKGYAKLCQHTDTWVTADNTTFMNIGRESLWKKCTEQNRTNNYQYWRGTEPKWRTSKWIKSNNWPNPKTNPTSTTGNTQEKHSTMKLACWTQ